MSNFRRNQNKRWQKLFDFMRRRWEFIDLQNADLTQADLDGVDLTHANLAGANLKFSSLRFANLTNATLRNANLRNTGLQHTELTGANLSDADLTRANLLNADLTNANLKDVTMNWNSHNLVGERLFQAAGNDGGKRMAAGYISISTDWCYRDLAANFPDKGLLDWMLETMVKWCKKGDNFPYREYRIITSEEDET